jgi:acyl-CoA reductase-like NAD-dependent aldehyde dehydrogenase
MSDDTYIGAITRAPQLDVLDAQVADAKAKGATLAADRWRALPGPGNWFQPTVFSQRDHGMELMREESFGPSSASRRSAATRSRAADERHALWPHRRRLHARRGACPRCWRR